MHPRIRVPSYVALLPLVSLLVVPLVPRAVVAQREASAAPQWEGRLVAVASPDAGALAGIGVNVRAGWYARVGVAFSAGAVGSAPSVGVQRLEGTARFLLDPFAEQRRAVYAGAGLAADRSVNGELRGILLAILGIEGAPAGRVVPAVELTLGGGARVAVVLRARRGQGR